jgi:uncharacterized phage-associated protein
MEEPVPAWSPEIANEFIRLAAEDRRAFDQLQLQALVYIAHGWRLALTGEPLTGDRPEAWDTGPTYRRLAGTLADYGQEPITGEIFTEDAFAEADQRSAKGLTRSDLDHSETDLIREIYQNYGAFEAWQLSALTRKGDTPWMQVFAGGTGKYRDIPHNLVKAQFVELLRQSAEWDDRS